MVKKLALNITSLLLALVAGVSCNIKEDMSDCHGRVILDYSAYSDEILDDIRDDEQIDIFVFNTNGICCDVRTFTYGALKERGLEFQMPLMYRGYKAVVWHGLNSSNYTSNRMMLGESYENFYLRLVYDTSNQRCFGVPDPLWASPLEPIEYCAKITRHRIHMTRLHTEIHVSVQLQERDGTLTNLEVGEFKPVITATNNVYQTDYSVDVQSTELEYTNEDGVMPINNAPECSCVGTLRVMANMECTLKVEDVDGDNIYIGGNDMLDLVDYMLATKKDSSLTDQQFLDLNKVWDINVIVKMNDSGSYVAVAININGWVKWFTNSGLN